MPVKDLPLGAKLTPVTRSKLEYGYDNKLRDPTRRVSLRPADMIVDLMRLNVEERGVLVTLFAQYWYDEQPPSFDDVRRDARLSRAKLRRVLETMAQWGLVTVCTGDRFMPGRGFGPMEGEGVDGPARRYSRKVPLDWAELREAVFSRDAYGCVYCGSGTNLHCDHVHPVALGGTNDIDNLATSCGSCNLSKGSKTVAEWRPDIAARFRR